MPDVSTFPRAAWLRSLRQALATITDPDRVIYAGSTSKTLAPALRIGWLVLQPSLLHAVSHEKLLADRGTARIEQHAFAEVLTRGELDRHLHRVRTRYRSRRDALLDALTHALPQATVHGVAAGLHVTVQLPDGVNEQAIQEEAHGRRIELETMADYRPDTQGRPSRPPARLRAIPESAIRAGVHELAKAIRAATTRTEPPQRTSAADSRGRGRSQRS